MATKKAPAKKATAEQEVNRNIPKSIADTLFAHGPKAYNPRAPHNVAAYERMCVHLDKAGEKGVLGKVLAAELTINGKHPDKTHFDFIGYLEQGGSLVRL